jgi:ribose 5-phosphate isomerase B
MKVAVSSDARSQLVDVVLAELTKCGHEVAWFGPNRPDDKVDWPVVTLKAAELVAQGDANEGIVMCWTGTGAVLVANKVFGIRAALCHDAETAKGARIWNHANILGLSLRATSEEIAREILNAWFETPFSADDWNLNQIQRIREIEEKYRSS